MNNESEGANLINIYIADRSTLVSNMAVSDDKLCSYNMKIFSDNLNVATNRYFKIYDGAVSRKMRGDIPASLGDDGTHSVWQDIGSTDYAPEFSKVTMDEEYDFRQLSYLFRF